MTPYKKFIEARFKIVDKSSSLVDFILNPVQHAFLFDDYSPRSIILKARQEGFSSLITALFTVDFLMTPNSYGVIVADNAENAEGLLSRVKLFITSWESVTQSRLPLKYDSKYHLFLPALNNIIMVGTAQNHNLGRSKTITNLHLSEAAFYPNLDDILSGAGQAVVPDGRIFIETTANGFNSFKSLWDKSILSPAGYTPLFYPASDFYSREFLIRKQQELGERFMQEYPATATEAFLSLGSKYFETQSLIRYLDEATNVQTL